MSSENIQPIDYTIVDDRIHTITCELNIVHHCNLSCRSCGHLSPIAERRLMTPETVFKELTVLSKHYQAEHVRLLGGEPLLHPLLPQIIQAVLDSGVTQRVRVVTNGLLLWRMSDEFWQRTHEVHVSVYPDREMSVEQRNLCETKAAQFGVVLEFLYFDRFRESYAELGTEDDSLIQRVYNTCQIAHRWRCHNIQDGYFFKCPQAHMLPRNLREAGLSATADGVLIEDTPDLKRRLLDYLEDDKPLECCRYCLGNVGKMFPHEELKRSLWREPQRLHTEDILDWDHLSLRSHLE